MTKFRPGDAVKVVAETYLWDERLSKGSILQVSEVEKGVVYAGKFNRPNNRRHFSTFAYYPYELELVSPAEAEEKPKPKVEEEPSPFAKREKKPVEVVMVALPRHVAEHFAGVYDAEGRIKQGKVRPISTAFGKLTEAIDEALYSEEVKAAKAFLESNGFQVTRL